MILEDTEIKSAIGKLIIEVGVENLWIRFRVAHRDMSATPFEAILQCDSEENEADEFHLEYSPVYRIADSTLTGDSIRPPLFNGTGRTDRNLKCLVIDASTSGPPKPLGNLTFPYLDEMPNGREEAETVAAMFGDQRQSGLISDVNLVTFDDEEALQNPVEFMKEKFDRATWDIVHFIGHSIFGARENQTDEDACIFLPGRSQPVPVHILMFADWLRDTRFVYLSSCQSAEVGFIHALAEKGIPSIIGYRWKVADHGAKIFASHFYRHLFESNEHRSVEAAFAYTQRVLKTPERHTSDFSAGETDKHIWAYPMLMMQNLG